jgi:hypothetical protein
MWAKGSKNDVELTISDIDSKIYFYRSYFPLMWAKGSTNNDVELTISDIDSKNYIFTAVIPLNVGKRVN